MPTKKWNKKVEKDNGHWLREDFEQRMTVKQWRELLLDHEDTVIFRGNLRRLDAKKLGAGVVSVFKVPLKEV